MDTSPAMLELAKVRSLGLALLVLRLILCWSRSEILLVQLEDRLSKLPSAELATVKASCHAHTGCKHHVV
jgi:hypothetical protein